VDLAKSPNLVRHGYGLSFSNGQASWWGLALFVLKLSARVKAA
jgi:hypothetical protein